MLFFIYAVIGMQVCIHIVAHCFFFLCNITSSFEHYCAWIFPELVFFFLFCFCLRCLERWPWWTAHISTETTTSRPSLRLCCCSSGASGTRLLCGLCACMCVRCTCTVSHLSVWNRQMCHWRGVAGDHVGLHARQTVRPRVRLQPRGGDDVWQRICHHLFYFLLHALRLSGTHIFLGFFFFQKWFALQLVNVLVNDKLLPNKQNVINNNCFSLWDSPQLDANTVTK